MILQATTADTAPTGTAALLDIYALPSGIQKEDQVSLLEYGDSKQSKEARREDQSVKKAGTSCGRQVHVRA